MLIIIRMLSLAGVDANIVIVTVTFITHVVNILKQIIIILNDINNIECCKQDIFAYIF